jgi:hypothetical protein
MHSGWLVELASLWAHHSSTLVEQQMPMPGEAVNEYWIRSRVRLDGWHSWITRLKSQAVSMSMGRRIQAWDRLVGVVEEVLLTEPLTRVSVAVAAALERRRIDFDSHSIMHSVHTSHLEVRNRALKIIVEGIDSGIPEAEELNRLRHYLEHWTDLLLGYFSYCETSAKYAFSTSRMEDFAQDYSQPSLGTHTNAVWSLQQAACREWIDRHCNRPAISPRMNQRICEAALAMIRPESFDSLGCMQSRLIQSIEHGIEMAGQTIERLRSDQWESLSKVLTVQSKPTLRIEL